MNFENDMYSYQYMVKISDWEDYWYIVYLLFM
jgi:hypothetical protein